jgi:hypothetical protein
MLPEPVTLSGAIAVALTLSTEGLSRLHLRPISFAEETIHAS